MKLKKRFAAVVPWLTVSNGETELIERICLAADNLGLECRKTDRYGFDLETGKKLTGQDVDFVLSTHFVQPKVQDTFSFVFLGNPVQYYHDWGFSRYSTHLLTHDDFLNCGTPPADWHLNRFLTGDSLHLPTALTLYHSVPEPVIPPTTMAERKLCYISTGWDRKRHQKLLLALDKANQVELYGSSKLGEWSAYRNYKGELPFDGRAVVNKIHELGAALVLSSDAHLESNIMSSRLFEGVAAGAVVICDQSPFARQYFGDSLLYVDPRRGDLTTQIDNHMQWMNSNPKEAARLALRAQKIFSARFSMDFCLKNIYSSLEERKARLRFGLNPNDGNNPLVQMIYVLPEISEQHLAELEEACCNQDYKRLRLTVVAPSGSDHGKLSGILTQKGLDSTILPVADLAEKVQSAMGNVLAYAIESVLKEDFTYLNIVVAGESPFHNNISSLVRLMQQNPLKDVASTAAVISKPDADKDHDAAIVLTDTVTKNLGQHISFGYARYMFRRSVLHSRAIKAMASRHRNAHLALSEDSQAAQSNLVTVGLSADTNTEWRHVIPFLEAEWAIPGAALRMLEQPRPPLPPQEEAPPQEEISPQEEAEMRLNRKMRRRKIKHFRNRFLAFMVLLTAYLIGFVSG